MKAPRFPFVARYRKEATGGLDDAQLRQLEERLAYLRELEARRASILDTIRGQSKLTKELEAKITHAATKTDLLQNTGAALGVANVAVESRTGTVGFLAGGDLTSRGVIFDGDGLIAGVMAGFLLSDLTLNVTSLQFNVPTPIPPARVASVGPGSGRTAAHLSGPTVGAQPTRAMVRTPPL